MKVAEITEALASRRHLSLTAPLQSFEVADDASEVAVTVEGDRTQFSLDETAQKAICRFLKIPPKYLESCEPEFRTTTLRYWLSRHRDAQATVESVGGELVSMHSPDLMLLPLTEVAGVLTRVFDPSDAVRMWRDENRLQLDVVSSQQQVEVPNPDRVPGRPEVGDVTNGGVRVLAYPLQSRPPSVTAYLERLICLNGATSDEKVGQIVLKGRTVPEVIEEMESAARRLMADMPDYLDRYARTAQLRPPGNPVAFAAQLAREHNLSRSVLDRALDVLNQVPEHQVSIFDVMNAFTQVATEQGVPYTTITRLQGLGGDLALNTERAIARCGACERLL